MNFLEIVNGARQDCGVSGGDLTSLANLRGENQRFFNWVRDAWLEIQRSKRQWKFLNLLFTFDTVIGQGDYAIGTGPGKVGITADLFSHWDVRKFRIYKDTVTFGDEVELPYWDYDSFRDRYRYGVARTQQARPEAFTVNPDNAIALGLLPDAVYRIEGRYWRQAQRLAVDADIPLCPAQFHDVIKYRAMKSYALYESAPEVLAKAEDGIKRVMPPLIIDQLPTASFGAPLA